MPFSDGLAAVQLNGYWGYIDKSFSVVIKPVYSIAGEFHEGKAVVRSDGGDFAVIDKTGAVLFNAKNPIIYNSIGYMVTQGGNDQFLLFNTAFQLEFDSSGVDAWKQLPGRLFLCEKS